MVNPQSETIPENASGTLFDRDLIITVVSSDYQYENGVPIYRVIAVIGSPGQPNHRIEGEEVGYSTTYTITRTVTIAYPTYTVTKSVIREYEVRIIGADLFSAEFFVTLTEK
jgi:hypothetical protein